MYRNKANIFVAKILPKCTLFTWEGFFEFFILISSTKATTVSAQQNEFIVFSRIYCTQMTKKLTHKTVEMWFLYHSLFSTWFHSLLNDELSRKPHDTVCGLPAGPQSKSVPTILATCKPFEFVYCFTSSLGLVCGVWLLLGHFKDLCWLELSSTRINKMFAFFWRYANIACAPTMICGRKWVFQADQD